MRGRNNDLWAADLNITTDASARYSWFYPGTGYPYDALMLTGSGAARKAVIEPENMVASQIWSPVAPASNRAAAGTALALQAGDGSAAQSFSVIGTGLPLYVQYTVDGSCLAAGTAGQGTVPAVIEPCSASARQNSGGVTRQADRSRELGEQVRAWEPPRFVPLKNVRPGAYGGSCVGDRSAA